MRRRTRRSQKSQQLLVDINVTPFVDILLVVLIAFIISAPLITRSLPIELPQGNLRQENPENQTGNMVVAVDQDEKIFFKEKDFDLNSLQGYLKKERSIPRSRVVYLQLDRRVEHGYLIKLMLIFKNAGFSEVGLAFNEKDL
jgi:biopolymer transport protein TolR